LAESDIFGAVSAKYKSYLAESDVLNGVSAKYKFSLRNIVSSFTLIP